jgi:uncharacterized protein YaiI (UPF0178 family)
MFNHVALQRRRGAEFEKASTRAEVDALIARWSREDAAVVPADDALAREVVELRQRLATIEGFLFRRDGLAATLSKVQSELRAEIKALEVTIPRFCGVHEAGRTYEPHSLVIRGGSLWISLCRTTQPPGTDAWQLCTKSGEVR